MEFEIEAPATLETIGQWGSFHATHFKTNLRNTCLAYTAKRCRDEVVRTFVLYEKGWEF